jgi:hypothetical protein
MSESLTQRRRVYDEGFRIVKYFQQGRICAIVTDCTVTVPAEAAPANSVPAAAVIRRGQALFGVTGRKAHVGGLASQELKASAQLVYGF